MNNFRVWDKINRKFLRRSEGEFAILPDGTLIISKSDYYRDFRNVNQDEYEILFSTGLKDKNGKEIFKGDLVTFLSTRDLINETFEVMYDTRTTFFKLKGDRYTITFGENYYGSYEVVGNIYENVK